MWGVCAIFFSYPSFFLPCAATAFWCIFFLLSSLLLLLLAHCSCCCCCRCCCRLCRGHEYLMKLASSFFLQRALRFCLACCRCCCNCVCACACGKCRRMSHVSMFVCMCACHVFTYGIFKLKIFLQQNKMRRMRHQLQLISWLKVSNTFVIFEQGRQMVVCKRKLWRIMRKFAM